METVELEIGSVVGMSNGATQSSLRPVAFEGEKLAEHSYYNDCEDGHSDTRGTRETLYKTADGRLVVHEVEWSQWQGEPNSYTLRTVTAADLNVDGAFEALGRAAGMGRPLTLDEALSEVGE